MFETALRIVRPEDLPVCFPGRLCVDYSPYTADAINATSALTPISPAIAAGCFALLGASFVLTVLGIRWQWCGSGVRPWLVALAVALLLFGIAIATVVGARFDAIAMIYSNVYGQPSSPPPSSLDRAWLLVLVAAYSMALLGMIAAAGMTSVAVLRRRHILRD